MKTLKGLLTKPVGIDEEKKEAVDALPVFRIMFKNCISYIVPKAGEDSLAIYQVGMKLMQDQDEIKLEDAEFKLLKEAVGKNPQGLLLHYHGQLMLKIKESEKEEEKLAEEKKNKKG